MENLNSSKISFIKITQEIFADMNPEDASKNICDSSSDGSQEDFTSEYDLVCPICLIAIFLSDEIV
jgi:hypothetical protein